MKELHFSMFQSTHDVRIIFSFYVENDTGDDLVWDRDSDKLTLEQALKKYPLNSYQWISITNPDLFN